MYDDLKDLLKRAEKGNPYRVENDGFEKEKIMFSNKSSDKILGEVIKLKDYIDSLHGLHESENKRYHDLVDSVLKETEKYRSIIDQQNKMIQTLMGKWADSKEFECIAFVPYRGTPIVIKNGKIISNEKMTSFDIDWHWDSKTEVMINNE